MFLAAFQQWCGINVVFNYAEEIFKAAGYDVSGVMFNQVITGVVNCVFTVASLWTSCFGLTLTFKPINVALGAAGTFWLYAAICVVGFFVVARFLRETKGRALS